MQAIQESNKYLENVESAMPNLSEEDQVHLDLGMAQTKATQALALAILALIKKLEEKS